MVDQPRISGASLSLDGGRGKSIIGVRGGDAASGKSLIHSADYSLGDAPISRARTVADSVPVGRRDSGASDSLPSVEVSQRQSAEEARRQEEESSTRRRRAEAEEAERRSEPPKVDIISNLDSSKSITDLIESGAMTKHASMDNPDEVKERTATAVEGDKPQITVRLADPYAPSNDKPDFIVKRDGTIEVLNNPEQSKDRNLVIELERGDGPNSQLTAEQQERVDQLVAYLNHRMPGVDDAFKGLEINDKQGLVSEELKQALNKDSFQEMPQQTRDQVERMNRLPGQGSMSQSEASEYFPQRDVPRTRGETDVIAAGKDAVAAVFNPDSDRPYETVRKPRGDRGYRVGRYGLSYNLWAIWLADLLGEIDPNDPEALKKAMKQLAAQGKIPANFAAKFDNPEFAQKFSKFLTDMKDGTGDISGEDVAEFMPKELQEVIATDLFKDFSETTNGDIGKVALAFHLGKEPDQLSAEDLNNPANQAIAKAAREFEQLARLRQQAGEGDRFSWARGPTSELQFKLLDAAKGNVGEALWAQGPFRNSVRGGRLGCAASVSEVLQEVGFGYANSAGVGGLSGQLMRNGWTRVPLSQASAGDVVFAGKPGTNWQAGGGNAHIGIIGERGRVYHNSSSSGRWVEADLYGVFNSRRFGNQRWALRPPDLSNRTA